MRVRIVSDGTAQGTKVVNADTGEEVEKVLFVSWGLVVEDGTSTAMCELRNVPCDIVTLARHVESEDMIVVPTAFKVEDEDWQWFSTKEDK